MKTASSLDADTDVVVVGGGVIGLAIALDLEQRGARVTVIERGSAMGQASRAAAGMLAAEDPANPAALLPLARLSVALYPEFLARAERLGGIAVPFQTKTALQYATDGTIARLAERSIDPRQLAAAMVAAVQATSIRLLEQTEVVEVAEETGGVVLRFGEGQEMTARDVVYAVGAWSGRRGGVLPRKGQMLRVQLPLELHEVHRSEDVYVVPRTLGQQAGTALIGATVEDAGFDTTVHADDLARLRALAAKLVTELGAEENAPLVEAWAGLRPATRDGLPVLGACAGRHRFIASGHYRNGILLAPATAKVVADLIANDPPAIDLSAFSAGRFGEK
jgi:glycine oxidase